MKLKELMHDCLETRGYAVTEERLNKLYEIYEDCQEWDNDKMLTGNFVGIFKNSHSVINRFISN